MEIPIGELASKDWYKVLTIGSLVAYLLTKEYIDVGLFFYGLGEWCAWQSGLRIIEGFGNTKIGKGTWRTANMSLHSLAFRIIGISILVLCGISFLGLDKLYPLW